MNEFCQFFIWLLWFYFYLFYVTAFRWCLQHFHYKYYFTFDANKISIQHVHNFEICSLNFQFIKTKLEEKLKSSNTFNIEAKKNIFFFRFNKMIYFYSLCLYLYIFSLLPNHVHVCYFFRAQIIINIKQTTIRI